ncbi:choice-of-anchor D domain-containing protein [Runella sp. SP2]|uniref:choice-of-anchor D domain-containing protein n=1 Tax=Runella sp. SP2 TaxID=2268026 RepID=UPI000F081EFB|nr:choice-of-anchor D domain-containing protein [Runella sp. SP2]AYQ30946.1 choice-of-anchor D domain [Runella sp. SP2]
MKNFLLLVLALLVNQVLFAGTKPTACNQVATSTETMTWNGSVSTDWTDACNWFPSGVPGAGNSVVIPNTTNDPVVTSSVSVKHIQILNGGRLTINNTGTLDISLFSITGIILETASTLINNGIINFSSTAVNIFAMVVNSGSTVTNTGTMNVSCRFGIDNLTGATFNNNSCGKIILTAENNNDFRNEGTFNNNGLLQVYWWLHNSGTITNNGVLKYETLNNNGTLNNNRILIDDNESPFFTFGASNNATVNGIYTDAAATLSAGSFTQATNNFSPSPSLPGGEQTLYAKITLSGGSCVLIVPFLYTNNIPLPVITANPNFVVTCQGTSASFSITATGATSYQWQVSSNGGVNWSDLSNATPYSNVTTPTLTISDVTGLNNRRYRCVATNSGGSTESNAAILTVSSPSSTIPVNVTWQGTISNDWNVACNWNPASVPGAGSRVNIPDTPNDPVIGTNATVSQIILLENAQLTVNSGASLNITIGNGYGLFLESGTTFTNNGTTTLQASSGEMYGAFYTEDATNVTINNNGNIIAQPYEAAFGAYQSTMTVNNASNATITVNGSGTAFSTFNSAGNIALTNNGSILYNGTTRLFHDLKGSITNNGLIKSTSGMGVFFSLPITITNAACAQLIVGAGDVFSNTGTVITNNGYLYIAGEFNGQANFTNNGVFKCSTLYPSISITNHPQSSLIVNNSVPIFAYGGSPASYNGVINGIFTDADATSSAGTFNSPNSFTPSNTLPAGSQTLYAKVTPSGNACSYIVPFTYTLVPTVTVSLSQFSISEDGASDGTVTFTLSNPAPAGFTVNFTVGGTATFGTDYTQTGATNFTSSSGSVTFQSGSKTATVTIDPSLDNQLESDETVILTITNSTGYQLGNPSSGTLTILNDDATEITIRGNNNLIENQSTTPNLNNFTDFGPKGVAGSVERTFSIENTRNLTLLLTGDPRVAISGPHANDFTVITQPPASISSSATFIIRFTPQGLGVRTANISIANNDLDENPYTFTIQGTGIPPSPEINIKGNANNILSGNNPPSTTNDTDFGNKTIGTGPVSKTFTIENTETGNLTLSGTPLVNVTGANPSDFQITTLPSATIPAGSSTTFVISFTPNAPGIRTAIISIENNDSNENPYTFNIQGTGICNNPTIAAGTPTNPSTCAGSNGSIPFVTTNLNDGSYTLNYKKGTTTLSTTVNVTSNAFTLSNLTQGTYSEFSITHAGCTGSDNNSQTLSEPAAPTIAAGTPTNPSTCAGSNGSIPFVTTNLNDGNYTLNYKKGITALSTTISIASNAFTLSNLTQGTYSEFSITNAGCTATDNAAKTLNDPAVPTIAAGTPTNPSTCAGSNGSIPFVTTNLNDDSYTLNYKKGTTALSTTINVASNAFTLSNLTQGTYSEFSITNTGCTATDNSVKTLNDPAAPTIAAGTPTNPSTCAGSNGSIPFVTTNLNDDSYTLNYKKGTTALSTTVNVASNAFTLSNLTQGTYSEFSITHAGCTGSDNNSQTLSDPAAPTIAAGTPTNPSTCAGSNGSIPFVTTNLNDGNYTLNYKKGTTALSTTINVASKAFTLSNLTQGTYSEFSITNTGCTATDNSVKTLNDPATPTIAAGTPTNPSTCAGSNGSIPFVTTNLNDDSYTLSYKKGTTALSITINVASNAFTLSNLTQGTYSEFSITNAGCTATDNAVKTLNDPAAPTIAAVTPTNPSTCAGSNGSIPFVTTNLNDGNYTLNYKRGTTALSTTVNVASNAFTLSNLTQGTYSEFSITHAGCTATDNSVKTLNDPATPTIAAGTPTNPSTCAGSNGSIPFVTTNLNDGNYTLNYKKGTTTLSTTVNVASNVFTLNNLTQGTYSEFSITHAGCTATDNAAKTLNDPAAPTIAAGTPINPSTCAGSNGSIPFVTTNLTDDSYTLNYKKGTTALSTTISIASNAFTLSNLTQGTYSEFSITHAGCTATDNSVKTLNDPATPTIAAGTPTNPSTCAGSNGSIPFVTTNLNDGSYTLSYKKGTTALSTTISIASNAFTLSNLDQGTYSEFSITNTGCTATDNSVKTLNDPATPTIAAGTPTNPSTCAGSNGSIPFVTTNLNDGNYTLNYKKGTTALSTTINVASNAFTLSNLTQGTYSEFSITNAGCTATDNSVKTLNDPATPTIAAGTPTNPSTCAGSNGSIPFVTTNLNDDSYTLNYKRGTTALSTTVNVASNAFTLSNLTQGTYSEFSITNAGCTATDNSVKTLNDPAAPTIAAGTPTNPSTCAGSNGSIPFVTTNLNDDSYTLNYKKGTTALSTTVNVASNAFTLSNLTQGTYSEFSITHAGCTATDNAAKTLNDPAVPTIAAGTPTNPSTCAGSNGSIPFVTTNLNDDSYTLNYKKGTTALSTTISIASNAFTLSNLTQGTYSEFSITNTGCTATDNSAKTLNDPATPTIAAGTPTNPSTCAGSNGSIPFVTTNLNDGNYTLNYKKGTTALSTTVNVASNAFTLSNLTQGTYSEFSITNTGCTATDNSVKTLNDPATPTIAAGTPTNPSTCAGSNGSIPFVTTNLNDGSYTLNYKKGTTALSTTINVASNAFTLSNLAQGTYSEFSITNTGCTATDNAAKTLNDPATPTIAAGTPTNPSTCAGSNGSIPFVTTNLNDGSYTLNYKKGTTALSATVSIASNAFTLSNLTQGTYSEFSITHAGCTATDNSVKTLNDPAAPTIAAGTPTNPSTCAGSNGSIPFVTTNLNDGSYTLNYKKGTTALSTTISIASNAFTLSNLTQGTYSEFSITHAGCTATDNSAKTLNDPATPTIAAGTPTNPSTCAGSNGSIPFVTTNLNDDSYTLNYKKGTTALSTTISIASNAFTLSNLTQGTYSEFSITHAGCTATDNSVKTINASTAPMMFTVTGGGVYCTESSGVAVGLNGSEVGINYQLKKDGNNTGSIVAGTGATISFGTQLAGIYTVEATHNSGNCSATMIGSVTVAVQNKPTITLSTLQQTLNEGNNPVLCDTDANPVNGLQFNVSGLCVSGSPVWRVQVGNTTWSDWSATAPVSQPSNNQPHRYQAACDANCASTYSGVIELTINNRASVPQNVSLLVDGVTVAVGETKEVCSLVNMPLTFNANCAAGEVILYSVDGGEYSAGVPVGLVDNQFHNYRVRCRKSDGTPSCVESESGVMRLKLVVIPAAPTVSLSSTASCDATASFSGQSTCGSLRTVWYNATTNVALPSLPSTVPSQTTSYYARCQTENGCVSEKSNVVTFTLTPTQVAPVITASQEIVCTGTTVTISANCPAGSQTFWNTGVTAPSFEVAFSNVTKQTYWAKCIFEGGCQSSESVRKDVYWNAFVVTLINIGESKSAIKTNNRSAWSSQFITRDGGPELEQSTQVNPTLYYVENANKMAPRYWTINVEACGLSTDGSLTFDMLATPEMGVIRSFNTHENNAPYFMYANREGWTELYAQNHPAYGFYQDNGAGGNSYDAGLPKGLYKLSIRYWDMKGWGSIYPSTRKPQGNVLAYQEYWFRIQSRDGVGVGAARVAESEEAKSKGQGSDNGKQITDNGVFATVLPNPVSNILRLKVQESKGQVVQAALTDASGREVLRRQFVPETNTHQEEFGVSELPAGVYFLQVRTETNKATLKVIKLP